MKTQGLNSFFCAIQTICFILFFGFILFFFSYHTLLSLSEAQQGLWGLLKAIIYNENGHIETNSQWHLSFKIINIILGFLAVLFSFSMFSSGLSALFYRILAKKYGYIEFNPVFSFKKAAKWQLYKYFSIFQPIMIFCLSFALILLSGIMFFNILVSVAGIIPSFVTLILNFINLNLMFFFAFAVLVMAWNFITLTFGAEIAVSEPSLYNERISLRAKRIVFSSPLNILMFLAYIMFVALLITQINSFNLADLNTFMIFFGLNIINYAGIKYLKTYLYINSLLKYYEKMKLSYGHF
ncbi:MAG TPA: hypothetical protein P5556_06005 [Candidatus Gastranaerophilales bacterium]|nr:hypothetical protein [Candidatus Gastranaerophilales bacterium]